MSAAASGAPARTTPTVSHTAIAARRRASTGGLPAMTNSAMLSVGLPVDIAITVEGSGRCLLESSTLMRSFDLSIWNDFRGFAESPKPSRGHNCGVQIRPFGSEWLLASPFSLSSTNTYLAARQLIFQ